ncbi:MAG: TonB-dependent receptor, partial [Pseudomonadota bacterium]
MLTLLAFAPHSVAQTPSQAIALPAQPLQASLEAIGKQYGVTVIAPAELVAGKAAAPVNGTLSAQDALFSVLAGTDLVLDRAPSGDFMLKPAPTLQQATQSSALEVEDVIIVKGTKLEGTLQDIETSIEIFDQSRIDREEIVDLLDVLLRIPNVTTGSGFGNDFSIRGIGRRGATGAGAGIASNVYVDGSPISPLALNRGPLSLWDVGQIEVLRGPQSSVQGRNALAGAIVISTNDPTYEFGGQVRATYGRYNDVQLAGAIGGPIVQDQIAARIAVDYQNFDGFITQRFNENFEDAPDDVQANARESILVRGKLLVEPKGLPSFATKFTVDYIDSTSGDPSPRIRSEIDVDNPAFEDFDFFDFVTAGPYIENNPETFRIVNETTYTLTDTWLLHGILTYENTEVVRSFDIFEGEPVDEGFTRNVFENEIFSAEARAEFTYQTLRGFIGGYYYDEQGTNANEAQDLVVNLPGAAGVNPADSVAISNSTGANGIENFAAFGQLEWDIDEHWRLNLGFRYDNERITAVNGNSIFTVVPDTCTLFVPGALVGQPLLPFTQAPCQFAIDAFLGAQFANIPGINTEFSDRFEAFLPRAAITYNFNDNNSVFISYQRGYRAGGAN